MWQLSYCQSVHFYIMRHLSVYYLSASSLSDCPHNNLPKHCTSNEIPKYGTRYGGSVMVHPVHCNPTIETVSKLFHFIFYFHVSVFSIPYFTVFVAYPFRRIFTFPISLMDSLFFRQRILPFPFPLTEITLLCKQSLQSLAKTRTYTYANVSKGSISRSSLGMKSLSSIKVFSQRMRLSSSVLKSSEKQSNLWELRRHSITE